MSEDLALAPAGKLDDDQARRFIALATSDDMLASHVRVVSMLSVEDLLAIMRTHARVHALQPIHRDFISALARLAGVKPRKARIFLRLDRGYITKLAREKLEHAARLFTAHCAEARRAALEADP